VRDRGRGRERELKEEQLRLVSKSPNSPRKSLKKYVLIEK